MDVMDGDGRRSGGEAAGGGGSVSGRGSASKGSGSFGFRSVRQRSISRSSGHQPHVTMFRETSPLIHLEEFAAEVFNGFDGSEVVITPGLVLFWKPPAPFGQWTASPFEVDGMRYVCAEQYMMAEKARLFGDVGIEREIMGTDNPVRHQRLGKEVSGFCAERWAAERCRIVFRGNVAKFTQDDRLKAMLLETGDRRMVEASPLDRIWGIGLAANNPLAYQPDQWRGLNLLGKVLEEVRAHIRGGQEGAGFGVSFRG